MAKKKELSRWVCRKFGTGKVCLLGKGPLKKLSSPGVEGAILLSDGRVKRPASFELELRKFTCKKIVGKYLRCKLKRWRWQEKKIDGLNPEKEN